MEKFGKHGPKSKALRPGQLGALSSNFALFVCRGIYSDWPESVACQLLIFRTSPLVVTERAHDLEPGRPAFVLACTLTSCVMVGNIGLVCQFIGCWPPMLEPPESSDSW